MKNLKTYLPLAVQTMLLVVGFLLINAGLENDLITAEENLAINLKLDNEIDPGIENWMTNLSNWDTKFTEETNLKTEELVFNSSLNEIAIEENIELENWMTDASDEFWELRIKTLKEDKEDEIILEDWMLSAEDWNK